MSRYLVCLLALLVPLSTAAGVPYTATLEEMAERADHILVGRVTGVDMIDGEGRQITDAQAMTGPGLPNTIRLRVSVDEVLVSTSGGVPQVLHLPLASHLHYSLGQIRQAHEGDTLVRLVLLKGDDFSGILPGVFFRPLQDKEEALRLHREANPGLP